MGETTNLKNVLLISVFLVATTCSIAGGSTIYADDDATAGGNGESWESAYKYLQDALAVSMSGDEIRVAQGRYRPDEDSAHPSGTGDREATFQLKNSVALRGGYAGLGGPDPDARDIEVYETVLSGDLLGNDGPDFANNSENSYHVVTGSGTDATAVVDGFTITGGNANGIGWENHGGGMFNFRSSPTLTSCTFSRNSADCAGGMRNIESSSTLTNCKFTENSAEGGGGMGNSGGNLTVTSCAFIDNSAEFGGGMYNMGSNPTMTNSTFSDNSADNGGGMCNIESSPTLTNCTFIHNLASGFGGGMLNMGSSPLVTNSTFNNNRAAWGGGMENENNSNLSLIGCTIKANSVTMGGGAIRNHTSRPTVLNCLIVGNQAQFGGAIHNENSSSNPTLINCTLSSNSATYLGGGIINHDSRPILNNCILWANSDNGGVDESAQIYGGLPAVNYCCFQGWTGNLGGIGNIKDDPWFVEPGYRNANGVWINGDYHLHRGSPCINAGDNSAVPLSLSTDLDGNPRITGGTVDMGVYEFWYTGILYVDRDAWGENDGSNWANAFNDLQDALAVALPGEEIRVAQGAYTPEGPMPDIRQASNPHPADGARSVSRTADLSWTAGSDATSHDVYFGTTSPPPFVCNQTATTFDPGTMAYNTTYYWCIDELSNGGKILGTVWSFTTTGAGPGSPPFPPPPLDRTATFQLINGVVIKGGYAGFGEPNADARDIEAYETILSGDLAGNDEPNFVNYEENSYHVVTGSGCDETAVLDGFTITAGNADENQNVPRGCGGGIYNHYGSPTVTNCNFSGNWSGWDGGGMYNCDSSKPVVTNCTFIGNAAKYGGGMYYRRNSNSTITNCTFSGNSARTDGGGMFIYESSSPILINCTFIENSAEDNGGGIKNELFSSPVLTDCTFSDNSAGVCGGGMLNNSEISPLLINCTFINNSSGMLGGGIYNGHSERFDYSELTLMNCTFKGNSAVVNGGAIDNSDNTASTIVNCIFTGNVAGESGGGISSWVNSWQTLTNCTFSGNSAGNGGGMYNNSSSPTVTNCILWGNTALTGPQIDIYGTSSAIVSYSDVQGGWPGEGNMNTSPCFVKSGHRDANGVWIDGDYHLLTGSPCIDRGTNNPPWNLPPIDIEGNPRPLDGDKDGIAVADIGAYEFFNAPPVACVVGGNRKFEAEGPFGVRITLDGSCSSDADSTPGTIDDIYDFNWYQLDPCDPHADIFLGNSQVLDCNLPIGDNIILLEVIDKAGASDTNEVTIIVQDTTPPDINCPPDVTLECPADTTPSATGKATASDTCGTVMITHSDQWQPGCGNTGTLTRTWTATDNCGNSSSCMQMITVVDTTPPEFEFSVAPTMLWPPDHKMVEITPSWTVSDECDATPQVSLVSIVANEGDDTIGDGHTSNDIQINEDGSIYLRSERSGTVNDRVYTITYQAVDECGNTTVRSATVSIPHDFKVLARIADRWLWAGPGRIPEDLNGDGVVNLKDFAKFAENWIK